MKAPDRINPGDEDFYGYDYCTVDTPTVYPTDDHVCEGLLGPDGEPITEGIRRQNPIGFVWS